MIDFIKSCNADENKSPIELINNFKEVFKFLRWKLVNYPQHFTDNDLDIVRNGEISTYFDITSKSTSYTKDMMLRYTEVLWHKSLINEYMIEGHFHYPKPQCRNLPIPIHTSRSEEVQLMNLFYPNNLFNTHLYERSLVPFSTLSRLWNLGTLCISYSVEMSTS